MLCLPIKIKYAIIERMCGRFTLTNVDPNAIAQAFALDALPPEMPPRYNVAPTQPVAAVFQNAEQKNEFAWMRWGLIPSWSKDASIAGKLINARAETLPEKPSFRAALSKRRCLIVTDGFYEWKADGKQPKIPMRITLENGGLFGFAGLYERWTDPAGGDALTTCTIITTAPNELMASIHNRMPAILAPDSYAAWLDYRVTDAAKVIPLLTPYPAQKMAAYPVARLVNNARAEGPELIARASG
jgi:putative SOS response-associated peptidase YedK